MSGGAVVDGRLLSSRLLGEPATAMSALGSLQPRDHAVAARTVATLCVVAAAVTIVFTVADPQAKTGVVTIAITVAVACLVIFGGWLMRYVAPTHALVWAGCPFAAIAVIAGLDILTADGSVAAQVFFFFPTLYGASQLRRNGAATVTVAAVAAELVVVGATLPTRIGFIDCVYVIAALVTTAGLLVAGGQRQDDLVAMLSRQAAIDPLTGLATRRVLDHAAQSALSGAASGDGTGLILLDVDAFKSVNDRFGHPAGDEVLVGLATLLVSGCRPNDIVSRLGGDEIALLLPGCSTQGLLRRADQIVWDVRTHAFELEDGQSLTVSVSAGVAHAPTHARDLRTLYTSADSALYEAKRAGGNRVGSTSSKSERRARTRESTSVGGGT
jgi:diguanylate cyclase (GGDEF)-like protein